MDTNDLGRSPDGSEGWRPVHGYAGFYEVSNFGRIRNADTGRLLSTEGVDKDGYPVVSLNRFSVRKTHALHKLVALSFHGDKCNALHNEVAHLDGDRTNARPSNLKWVSKVENRSHRKLHGTECSGEAHGSAKLTAEKVAAIRAASASARALATTYGVSKYTINDVRQRRSWKHV